MKLKKTAVKATLAGAMGAAAVGLAAGVAQADPFPVLPPPPWPMPAPADPGISVEGPSLNAPGISVEGPAASIAAPAWAPPQPPPPPWAPFAPVSWNAEAQAWGVYTNAGFQPV